MLFGCASCGDRFWSKKNLVDGKCEGCKLLEETIRYNKRIREERQTKIDENCRTNTAILFSTSSSDHTSNHTSHDSGSCHSSYGHDSHSCSHDSYSCDSGSSDCGGGCD